MDTREIIDSLIDIEQQKSISKQKVVDVIKQGLIKACEKQFGEDGKYVVNINEATGDIIITRMIEVVNDVSDNLNQISIKEAGEFADDIKEGDELQEKLTIKSFGRLAINAMKQHITNELLEEERISLFNEFSGKIDNLVNGSIKKITPSRVYINLNRLEAIMPMDETIPGERYRIGQLIKAVIIDVEENKGDPRVYLSRRSDKFLKRLMEFEVPEIEDGTVIIKGIARLPGIKSKIAVMSIDDKIDPVGACVGVKGSRIRTIIKELNNEHIDIIQWSYDPIIFTQRVISPGVVIRA
ncbi:MAG: transcription termination factor NusA, partial [candidate division WOR-3 bacterium]|nr:transcription termination factor NusA [candidate division WOR-3 bacterium]